MESGIIQLVSFCKHLTQTVALWVHPGYGFGFPKSRRLKVIKNHLMTICLTILLSSAAITVAHAGDSPGLPPPSKDAESAFPAQKHFSPYAGRNFPTNVYWGDTHLHTGMSMDAGAFGARLMPEDAYRFARGEEVTSSPRAKR